MSATASDMLLDIESLDGEGRGVARHDGKVVFVEGGLPGERVQAMALRSRKNHELAKLTRVLKPSPQRVADTCPHFGTCGGCAMQHLHPQAQVAVKQRVLEDALARIGGLGGGAGDGAGGWTVLSPLHGPSWHYRWRARLSARLVPKKGGMLVGFHEKRSSYVADIRECRILPRKVSDLLLPLRALLGSLSCPDRLPQIELAAGERCGDDVGEDITVLILRHMEPLTTEDIQKLSDFGSAHAISWWLQPKGPDSAHPLHRQDENRLAYHLPEFGLRMAYRPTDFTQINPALNRVMVSRALQLLHVQPQHRVADFFCGLGNFSLPLATRTAQVLGVEGSEALTQRAQAAAQANGLSHNTRFLTRNLFEVDAHWLREQGRFDRMLIDPPREGAEALALALAELAPDERPGRMVYVSCNPATLARDTAILVHRGGWQLQAAGILNMFPHTAHVESIAVFEV